MKHNLVTYTVAILLPVLVMAIQGYESGLLVQYACLALAAASLAMCWGFAGIMTLGHAVSFALGAYAYAVMDTLFPDVGTVFGVLLGVVVGGVFSLAVGWIGLRGRHDDVSFGLFTLLFLYGAAQLVLAMPNLTGGFNGLASLNTLSIGSISLDQNINSFVISVIISACLVALHILLRSGFGGLLVLVKESPLRAASSGYNVPKIRIVVFMAAGAIAALAGGLYASQVSFVSPELVTTSMAINFIIWVLIGSRTSVVGSFVAAIIMSLLTTWLSEYLMNWWSLILGIVFLGFVLFAPDGVASLLSKKRRLSPVDFELEDPEVINRQSSTESYGKLEARNVNVFFGQFHALQDVHVTADSNEIHVLIGPNGAGKSTLLNALSGIYPGSRGEMTLSGKNVFGMPAWELAHLGLGRKYQKPSIAPSLSVGQNIALGYWGPRVSLWELMFKKWSIQLNTTTSGLMKATNFVDLLDMKASDLSHGQKQILELLMVVAAGPSVLLLDEPAAGMTKEETRMLGDTLRKVVDSSGIPILMVEHDMELVHSIADRVTVLASGLNVASGPVSLIENDPRVRQLYVG